jgi:hypothetical protein
MSKDLEIPILRDLISSGIADDAHEANEASLKHENVDLEIPEDDLFAEASREEPSITRQEVVEEDHIEDYGSVQELLIEEEIRLILDKHMEAAYEEIIRLINHKLS